MSSLTIGIVAEGPNDIELLQHIVHHIIPGEHRFLTLQPEQSETKGFGSFGGGWRGVLEWCKSIGTDPGIVHFLNATNPSIDILLIHLDADVSREPEINCSKPCPNAEDTVIELEKLILSFFEKIELDRVILCIPCDNSETWALATYDENNQYHNPPESYIECIQKPENILARPPIEVFRFKEGKPKKSGRIYRELLVPRIVENWATVISKCSQAEKLHNTLSEIAAKFV